MYERRCIRSLMESRDWLRGSRLHVLIECERERERERERESGGERESPPPHLRTNFGWPREFTKGGGNSSTLRIVCFYHIFFYKVYHFLIYRYVHCYDYICTFLYNKGSPFFYDWIPMFQRECYLRKFSVSALFLDVRAIGSRWRLVRACAGLLFHGMKGKYLLASFVLVIFPRK